MRLPRIALAAATVAMLLGTGGAGAEDAKAPPLVAIDAGHGGNDYGTSGAVDGKRLIEKELTLRLSKELADTLQKAGYRTMLTRSGDAGVGRGDDRNGDGKLDQADELQARIDRANEASAAILVSLHFNGSLDRTLRGPEIYYSPSRPFAAENKKLAESIMAAATERLGEAKRPVTPRGVLRDSVLGGHLFLLGPQGGKIARESKMPAALVEGMFLTNDEDLKLLNDPTTLQALVRGYADGIARYLGPPPKAQPKRARVAGAAGAYLRPAPLLGTAPLATLPPGATVDLAEPAKGDAVRGADGWWRVDWQGKAGYVFGSLLEPVTGGSAATGGGDDPKPTPNATPVAAPKPTAPTPTAERRGTVRTDEGLPGRLRSEPNLQAEIVGRVPTGGQVEVLGAKEGETVNGSARWLSVRVGDTTGWIWGGLVE